MDANFVRNDETWWNMLVNNYQILSANENWQWQTHMQVLKWLPTLGLQKYDVSDVSFMIPFANACARGYVF